MTSKDLIQSTLMSVEGLPLTSKAFGSIPNCCGNEFRAITMVD